jgi:hypothetical protein
VTSGDGADRPACKASSCMNVMKVVPRGYDKRARKLFSPAECAAAERNRAGAGRVARDLQVLSQSRRIVYFCWADRGDGMAPVGFHRDNFDGRVRPKRPMRDGLCRRHATNSDLGTCGRAWIAVNFRTKMPRPRLFTTSSIRFLIGGIRVQGVASRSHASRPLRRHAGRAISASP